MKLAISGKGGVGKTTVAAALARSWVQTGRKVLVVDADPDANLAIALGFPADLTPKPIAEMTTLIEERTGAKVGVPGQMFKLNPRVDDIPDSFAVKHDGVGLMAMGKVKAGGAGCLCPENAFLKALMHHLIVERDEVVIVDMVAGTEHLGRGTASHVDAIVVVTEPTLAATETATRVSKFARQLGVKRVIVVGNKIRSKTEEEFIRARMSGLEFAGFLPFSEAVEERARTCRPNDFDPRFQQELDNIRTGLDAGIGQAKHACGGDQP